MSRHDLTRCVSFIILITLVLVTLRLASSLARERGGDATSAVPFDRSHMLRHLAHQVMSPTYTAFATAVHELNRTTTPFCDAPTAVHLATLQDAWRRAVALWQRSAAFRLGPASAVASSIDFWPTRPRLIERHLTSSQPLTAAFLASVGSAARGLPAIEYLLFDPI
ncbi:MAG: imelysin family protein, partial [Candidatus Tectomicrobia bacterium]